MTGPRGHHLRAELRDFAEQQAPQLPLPGRGATPDRFAALAELGRGDLSVTRLCEAHADALAIMADAGHEPPEGATFGVWAARGRTQVVEATRLEDGWHLRGEKPWCSGVGSVSHALVTAEAEEGAVLVSVPVEADGIEVTDRPWAAPAFAELGTVTLAFDVTVPLSDQIGAVRSYLDRPGFWHGASGVAACWAGGLAGLVERAEPWWRNDPHAAVHRAALEALAWAVSELVAATGRDIDAHPSDTGRAHVSALRLRHLVDDAVTEGLMRFRRACGPAPFAFDEELGRHVAELELYVRQSHAERDLEALSVASV
jgi:alkylation response protein AidB-like acyl-CoA dehydrogenase